MLSIVWVPGSISRSRWFYAKTRLTSHIMGSDTQNLLFLSLWWRARLLAHLCVLSQDDMTTMAHDIPCSNLQKKGQILQDSAACWPAGITVTLKFMLFWSFWCHVHLSLVVVVWLGKSHGKFSKRSLVCTPVTFNIVKIKGPKPIKWLRPQGSVSVIPYIA